MNKQIAEKLRWWLWEVPWMVLAFPLFLLSFPIGGIWRLFDKYNKWQWGFYEYQDEVLDYLLKPLLFIKFKIEDLCKAFMEV